MGLPLSDVDMCGPARPERVMALCEGTQVRAVLRAAHFGTVELHVTDEDGVRHMAEYTTFREDSYRCGHRPDAVRLPRTSAWMHEGAISASTPSIAACMTANWARSSTDGRSEAP